MNRFTYHLVTVLGSILCFLLAAGIIIPAIQKRGLADSEFGIVLAWIGLVGSPLIGILLVELTFGRAWGLAFSVFRRRDQPKWYWFFVGAHACMIVLAIVVGVRAIYR